MLCILKFAGTVESPGGDSLETRMSIISNGNVGIGNTSPAEKLHIHGEGEMYNAIMISGATNTGEGIEIMSRSKEHQTGGFIFLLKIIIEITDLL